MASPDAHTLLVSRAGQCNVMAPAYRPPFCAAFVLGSALAAISMPILGLSMDHHISSVHNSEQDDPPPNISSLRSACDSEEAEPHDEHSPPDGSFRSHTPSPSSNAGDKSAGSNDSAALSGGDNSAVGAVAGEGCEANNQNILQQRTSQEDEELELKGPLNLSHPLQLQQQLEEIEAMDQRKVGAQREMNSRNLTPNAQQKHKKLNTTQQKLTLSRNRTLEDRTVADRVRLRRNRTSEERSFADRVLENLQRNRASSQEDSEYTAKKNEIPHCKLKKNSACSDLCDSSCRESEKPSEDQFPSESEKLSQKSSDKAFISRIQPPAAYKSPNQPPNQPRLTFTERLAARWEQEAEQWVQRVNDPASRQGVLELAVPDEQYILEELEKRRKWEAEYKKEGTEREKEEEKEIIIKQEKNEIIIKKEKEEITTKERPVENLKEKSEEIEKLQQQTEEDREEEVLQRDAEILERDAELLESDKEHLQRHPEDQAKLLAEQHAEEQAELLANQHAEEQAKLLAEFIERDYIGASVKNGLQPRLERLFRLRKPRTLVIPLELVRAVTSESSGESNSLRGSNVGSKFSNTNTNSISTLHTKDQPRDPNREFGGVFNINGGVRQLIERLWVANKLDDYGHVGLGKTNIHANFLGGSGSDNDLSMIIPRNAAPGMFEQQERIIQRLVDLYFLEWILKADYGGIISASMEDFVLDPDFSSLSTEASFAYYRVATAIKERVREAGRQGVGLRLVACESQSEIHEDDNFKNHIPSSLPNTVDRNGSAGSNLVESPAKSAREEEWRTGAMEAAMTIVGDIFDEFSHNVLNDVQRRDLAVTILSRGEEPGIFGPILGEMQEQEANVHAYAADPHQEPKLANNVVLGLKKEIGARPSFGVPTKSVKGLPLIFMANEQQKALNEQWELQRTQKTWAKLREQFLERNRTRVEEAVGRLWDEEEKEEGTHNVKASWEQQCEDRDQLRLEKSDSSDSNFSKFSNTNNGK